MGDKILSKSLNQNQIVKKINSNDKKNESESITMHWTPDLLSLRPTPVPERCM